MAAFVRTLIAAVTFLGAISPASAISGKTMMDACVAMAENTQVTPETSGGLPMYLRGYCDGTIRSLVEFSDVLGFCVPSDPPVTAVNAASIVTAYIQEHPAEVQGDLAQLAVRALRARWPCPVK
jgi:hypothetical protein